MIAILNTSILTEYGVYSYVKISASEASYTLYASTLPDHEGRQGPGWISAVGHESTAQLITQIFAETYHKIVVPMNRIAYRQAVGDQCVVFKMKGRPKEGSIMTMEEMIESGYEFGLLTRLS